MVRSCIGRLTACSEELQEIIVVVDGFIDEPDALHNEHITAIQLSRQSGPACARNLGARHATGDLVFFVDADALITSDTILQLRRFFAECPEYDAAIGSYCDIPGEPNFLSQYKNLFHHYVHQNAREEAFTFWTGCGAIRRDVFLRVGGFDESYASASIEDIELGYRLRAAGYRIRLLKDVQVTHLKRWTLTSLIRADLLHRAIPWTELILSTKRFDDDLNIDRSTRCKVAASWLLVLLALLGFVAPLSWLGAVAIVVLLLVMDLPLLRFFSQKRGFMFAFRTVPWQWLYYFYSGVGFCVGLIRHLAGRGRTVLPRDPLHDIGEATG